MYVKAWIVLDMTVDCNQSMAITYNQWPSMAVDDRLVYLHAGSKGKESKGKELAAVPTSTGVTSALLKDLNPSPPSHIGDFFCLPKVAPNTAGAGGVPKPGKGTSAEEWVPRGNTAPNPINKGKPQEEPSSSGPAAGGDGDDGGVAGMDVDEAEEDGAGGGKEGEAEGEEEDEEEEKEAPLALVSVMTHRNGCKLLLRLLAPEHTGYERTTKSKERGREEGGGDREIHRWIEREKEREIDKQL